MNLLSLIFDWVLEAGMRASLLVPVVLGAQWLLRKHLPASWRYALWLPVLLALLVPALPILPPSLVQWLTPPVESPSAPITGQALSSLPSIGNPVPDSSTAPSLKQETPSTESATESALSTEPAASGSASNLPVPTTVIETPTAAPAYAPTSIDWRKLTLGVWVLGAVAVGLSILVSFTLMMRRVKRNALPLHHELLARVARLAPAAGLRDVPRVLKSSAIASPAVCGFWRPVLLLNDRFEADFSEDEMDMILRHELAHIRRGDLQLNALQCVLLAVHWFNPILWLAFFRARADREAACDEAVVRGESAPRRAAYGHALLKMETAFAPSGLCLGFVGILQGQRALHRRIEAIIARRRLNAMSATALVISIAVIALVGISGVGAEPDSGAGSADSRPDKTQGDAPGEYDLEENKDHPGYVAVVYKWTRNIARFDAELRALAATAKVPEQEEFRKRIEDESGGLEVITDGYGGVVDFNAAKGTVQYEANKKFAGEGGMLIDWEFELAGDTKIHYDKSTTLNPKIARAAEDGKQDGGKPIFSISIAKTSAGPFRAGDRVRLKAAIDDFSRFKKGYSRSAGLVAIHYLEESPNPVFCLRFQDAELTLVEEANRDEGKGENRSDPDNGSTPPAGPEKNGAAAQKGDTPLFVVRVKGKDGFIDPKGKLVIPATFQKAYPFQEGLAAVQMNERWGFIDPQGRMVIEPRFAMVGFFSEGLAAFRTAYHRPWGYINRKGEVDLKPRFDTAEEFRKGIAKVGFETTRGKLLGFLADARLVPLNYRFIDRTGAFVEDPGPLRFATGAPGELIPFTKDDKFGYIDAKGKVVIPPQFVSGLPFSDGLAAACKKDLFGYIDKSGKFVIPPRFQYFNDFSEGLAGVPLGDEGWGFIDHTGKTVIPPRFGWVLGSFRHGIVEVVFDGKAGYINTKGEWVWPPSE